MTKFSSPTPPLPPVTVTADALYKSNQGLSPLAATLIDSNCMISLEEPETPPPSVPKGYYLLTEREHFELIQQAERAKSISQWDELWGKTTDYRYLTQIAGLVAMEMETTGTGMEKLRAAKLEAERAAQSRSKRQIGRLGTKSEIRRELAALYRETYQAPPEDGRHFTRMAYMLDCLARPAEDPQKTENAGQSEA